jgi:periplasmic protein TonB
MFEDSLVESSGRLRGQNPWTTAASFTVQTALAGFVVLLSLLYTDALPIRALISTVEAPPPPVQAAPTARVVKLARSPSEFEHGVLIVPRQIPKSIATIRNEQPIPEANALTSLSVPGGGANAAGNSMVADMLRSIPAPMPKVTVQKIRVSSGIAQGLLIHQVNPQYPPLARQARIQGTVVLQAVIGKDGTIQDLHVVSGHPLLTTAAIEAVRQWRYRPYYLNNEPVSVDTQINVTFTLSDDAGR